MVETNSTDDKTETTMRHDIEFDAERVILRGWFYEADGATGPAPCVVMAQERPAFAPAPPVDEGAPDEGPYAA